LSGLTISHQKLLLGFPPKPLIGAMTDTLKSVGLNSGETLILQTKDASEVAADEVERSAKQSAAASTAVSTSSTAAKTSAEKKKNSVPFLDEGTPVVKRVISDDNSCLFNSIGYSMKHSKNLAQELRELVAGMVMSNPTKYTKGHLDGKTPDQYAEYIMNPSRWGGGIELEILSEHYKTQIATADVQTSNMFIYGEANKDMKRRIYLIYNGIHYDCVCANNCSDQSKDITIFNPEDELTKAKVVSLVRQLHQEKRFTNVNSFSLRCDNCKQALVGQTEAVEHSTKTGHKQFSEYVTTQ